MIPWATFTDPEVARVGLNETEAKEKGIAYEVTTYDIDDLDRAIADGEAHGVVKVLTVPGKDKILGATIVGEHAGDLIAEYVTAMKHGIGLNKILGTIHIYPDAGRGEQVRRRQLEAGARVAQDIGVAGPVSCLDAGLVRRKAQRQGRGRSAKESRMPVRVRLCISTRRTCRARGSKVEAFCALHWCSLASFASWR